MTVGYNPKIVTNGLILCLDAANPKSYPGSGTTWTDVIGKRTATLTNGPTYSASNKGRIQFDGTNDYATFGDIKLVEQANKTISAWVYITSTLSAVAGIVDKEYDVSPNYGGWGFWAGPITGGNGLWFWTQSNKDLKDTKVLSINTWYNVAVAWNNSTKSASFYVNGLLSSTATDATITENASNAVPLTVGTFRGASATYGGGSGFFPGYISNAMIYNRILTVSEISSNFNSLRGRYGV